MIFYYQPLFSLLIREDLYQPINQLAKAFNQLIDNLDNRIPTLLTTLSFSEAKAYLLKMFSNINSEKLNNFLF